MTLEIQKHILKIDLWFKKFIKMLNAVQLTKFCCLFKLRQGTILIAMTELSLTSFLLFLMLLATIHAQDLIDLVGSDLAQLEANDMIEGNAQDSLSYIISNEKKMLTGQQVALIIMFIVWAALLLTSIHFISCVLLLYGAIKNSPKYLLPWILTALFNLLSGFVIVIMILVSIEECKLSAYIILLTIYAGQIYGWLVVSSFYQELKT